MSTNLLFGQVQKDTIQIKKAGTYISNGKKLTPKQLFALTKTNPEADVVMKRAKSNFNTGSIFSSAGGFLLGWQLGAAISGGKASWAGAGIGAGLIAASIPFSAAYVKHSKQAVTLYNNGLKQTASRKLQVYPGLTSSGIGLTARF